MSATVTRTKLSDEFSLAHVGSTLLEDLAKGIYQTQEVVREYVQNAVDAHRLWTSQTGSEPEGPVQIEIRGRTLTIMDYGIGMDQLQVRNVKAIAVSSKRQADVRLTGHKGVGIWAGLSYFRTLRLMTTKNGSDRGYELIIHFKKIVDSINEDTDIGAVLNPNYEIYESAANSSDHFTNVVLEGPTRSEQSFIDPEMIKDAIRRVCPCELDPNFALYKEVSDWYRSHQIQMYPIEVDGERVYRTYPSAVEHFKPSSITVNDRPVAYYWQAVSRTTALFMRVEVPELDTHSE
jgi:hypothetical protein